MNVADFLSIPPFNPVDHKEINSRSYPHKMSKDELTLLLPEQVLFCLIEVIERDSNHEIKAFSHSLYRQKRESEQKWPNYWSFPDSWPTIIAHFGWI